MRPLVRVVKAHIPRVKAIVRYSVHPARRLAGIFSVQSFDPERFET